MKIVIAKQSIGKRRPVFVDYDVSDQIVTLRDLLVELVTIEVTTFCQSIQEVGEDGVCEPLSEDAILSYLHVGKVGFGAKYNDKQVALDEAIETALLAFKDGLFRIFVDEKEIEGLEETIDLKEGSKIAILRLTFLAGRRW